MSGFSSGGITPVPTRALWNWNTTDVQRPHVVSFPLTSGGTVTKTGLLAEDLQNYIGIPIQTYGKTPVPIPYTTIQNWIRWAEDNEEQETNLLLCPTWIAAPPARTLAEVQATGLIVSGNGGQVLGVDYDRYDAPYDFIFSRALDDAWMAQKLRYRPLRDPDSTQFTAMKNYAYIYPLLNEFFKIPVTWFVEDQDFGYIRLVPAANVQMLPLFAMQLAFMGFSDTVPGGMWIQYVAGLTAADYSSAYSFVQELVLSRAAMTALAVMQGSINFGAIETNTMVDGLQWKIRYSEKGAFHGQIQTFFERHRNLRKSVRSKIGGPAIGWM